MTITHDDFIPTEVMDLFFRCKNLMWNLGIPLGITEIEFNSFRHYKSINQVVADTIFKVGDSDEQRGELLFNYDLFGTPDYASIMAVIKIDKPSKVLSKTPADRIVLEYRFTLKGDDLDLFLFRTDLHI